MSDKIWFRLVRCPQCKSQSLELIADLNKLVCFNCNANYPITNNRPVLLRHDNPLFQPNDYLNASPLIAPPSKLLKLLPTPSVNLASARVIQRLKALLLKDRASTVLVVGGGCQRSWLDQWLTIGEGTTKLNVIYSDIDIGADVDLFCDGHDLPFVTNSMDAVITTAVLEHVLYPERVVAEIRRVLKQDGLLYSELPFLQQVHEGAYDFTRYTLSGHRRLFNGFTEIESGMVAGPATAFVWSIENLALAFVRRSILRRITKVGIRLVFSWIKWLDYLVVNRPEAMDGASCTYFF